MICGLTIPLRSVPWQPKPMDVQVISHHMQRYAVWFGGSMLASTVSSLPRTSICNVIAGAPGPLPSRSVSHTALFVVVKAICYRNVICLFIPSLGCFFKERALLIFCLNLRVFFLHLQIINRRLWSMLMFHLFMSLFTDMFSPAILGLSATTPCSVYSFSDALCPFPAVHPGRQPEFYQVCHTKAQYEEYGPSICRHNPVFGTMSWAAVGGRSPTDAERPGPVTWPGQIPFLTQFIAQGVPAEGRHCI